MWDCHPTWLCGVRELDVAPALRDLVPEHDTSHDTVHDAVHDTVHDEPQEAGLVPATARGG